MTDIKIESIGNGEYDLAIEGYDLVLVGGDEATWPLEVVQRVVYAVCTWYGECAFDREIGFPWRESVFGKQPIEGIASLVHEQILKVDGVQGFADQPTLTIDTTARRLFIRANVDLGDFIAPVDVTIPGAAAP